MYFVNVFCIIKYLTLLRSNYNGIIYFMVSIITSKFNYKLVIEQILKMK